MAAEENRRREEFLKKGEDFRSNAFNILTKMLDWCNITPGSKLLVDEIIHSIFFLGKINTPPFPPQMLIDDKEMLSALQEKYPRPFQFYSSQLPRRSPFSCVLDMIVLQQGQVNESQIMQFLSVLVNDLKPKYLVSSTICVSQKSNNAARHYGVSMSTDGPLAGRIVIATACFGFWDNYVADAVMTYDSNKQKKPYFDATIKLPQFVRCQAFNLRRLNEMPPCKSCGNLFGLSTTETREWPYGNCAEVECVSNLLENEGDVKEQARPTSDTVTEQNRRRARASVMVSLQGWLRTLQFNTWRGEIYIPS